MLLAVAFLGGSVSVWADGTKRTLDSNDYTGGTTDWTAPNGNAVYKNTGTSPRKYYAQTYGNTNRNASTYKLVSYSYTAGTGYTTSDVSTLGYNIEFDFLMRSGDVDDRSQSEFVIPTTDPSKITANNYYSGTDYIFAISQPARTNGNSADYGSAIGIDETWYVNDLSNSGTSITLTSSKWYHVKLVVTATSVDYTISEYTADGSSEMSTITNGTGSKTVTSMPTIKGFWGLVGRQKTTNGLLNFTNFDMYDYVDTEVVTAPTIGTPAYAGTNRTVEITAGESSKSNTVTTYYTTNGSDPTSSSSVYSSAITITENCTLKAISISSEGTASTVASQTITVGKLTLNAPTFSKAAYSNGSYTITIANDQSSLAYVPASTTIKYRVGTSGDFATYSSGVAVSAGSTLYAYVEADNYTTSSTNYITAVSLPAMTLDFGQNFAGVVDADMNMAVSEGPTVTNSVSGDETNYFIPSADGTNALTDENISFYFSYSGNDQNKWWTLKTTGMYTPFGRGSANMRIGNLTAGQIVVVNASAISSVTGLTELSTYNYGTMHYYTATATTAYVNIARYNTIYSVDVYTPDNEIVGALDFTTSWKTATSTPVTLKPGDSYHYSFVNHSKASVNDQNWQLIVANADNTSDVMEIRADWWENLNGADYSTYNTHQYGFSSNAANYWNYCPSMMEGVSVDMTVTFTTDKKFTMTSTNTAADGTTTWTYNFTSDHTDGPDLTNYSSLTVYLTVSQNWLEIESEGYSAVSATIPTSGFGTIASAYALDCANLPSGVTAYKVSSISASAATLTEVTEAVAAGTGLILSGTAGTYSIPVATSGSDISATNKLKAAVTATTLDDGSFYILQSGKFCLVENAADETARTVPAGKAYLLASDVPGSGSGARALTFTFGDEASGVEEIENGKMNIENGIYDLQGRRVNSQFFDEQSGRAERTIHNSQLNKGLYIVNGKKVIK